MFIIFLSFSILHASTFLFAASCTLLCCVGLYDIWYIIFPRVMHLYMLCVYLSRLKVSLRRKRVCYYFSFQIFRSVGEVQYYYIMDILKSITLEINMGEYIYPAELSPITTTSISGELTCLLLYIDHFICNNCRGRQTIFSA